MKMNNYQIGYRFDHSPRWLQYSGLPQQIKGSGWQLLKLLLELDSRYSFESMGKSFHYSHEKLALMLGRRRDFIRNNLEILKIHNLIRYSPSVKMAVNGCRRMYNERHLEHEKSIC